MAIDPGSALGPYEVTGKLGEGGMGEVYRARDTRLDRNVALKVLPDAFTSDPERLARFEREAKVLASLNHPHIGHIYGLEEADGVQALVLELVDGPTLADRLRQGPIPLDEALSIARQIAEALEAAHEQGIVHRDLKPANVKVRPDGIVKVLDFGLAKALQPSVGPDDPTASQSPTLTAGATELGVILGTPSYMAPEQARGKPVDRRADIWAFGCVLYEMLLGERPFLGSDVTDTLAAVLRSEPSWEALRKRLPERLLEVLERCLQKQPAHRYHAIADVRLDLERLSRTVRNAAEPPSSSIAVLPFANLGGDSENEYFSDGLTEEIISDLSKIRSLRVISRTSTMQFKGKERDLKTIASDLNAGYVLEGSVRRAGTALRIAAQLVDAEQDVVLWGDKYVGTLEDVFDIQEKVSREIASSLEIELSPNDDRAVGRRPITDVHAYDWYLRARHEYQRFTLEGCEAAQRYLERALELEGPNAELYVARGYADVFRGSVEFLRHRQQLTEARGWAEKAFELEPESATAKGLLGMVLFDSFETAQGLRLMKEAFDRDPNDTDNLTWLSLCAAIAGHSGEATMAAARLEDLDPLNASTMFFVGYAHLLGQRASEAEKSLAEGLAIDAQEPRLRVSLAQVLAGRGDLEGALSLLEVFSESSEHPWSKMGAAFRAALGPDQERLRAVLPDRYLEAFQTDMLYSWHLSEWHSLAGLNQEALHWLKTAVRGGFWNHEFLGSDPLLARIRAEGAFEDALSLARQLRATIEPLPGVGRPHAVAEDEASPRPHSERANPGT